MSTTTTNYAFVKPDYTDQADIQVLNSNTDSIDTILKNRTDRLAALEYLLAPARCIVYVNTSSTSINDNTEQAAVLDSKLGERGGTFTITSNRVKVPVNGYYKIWGWLVVRHTTATDGTIRAALDLPGTNTIYFSNKRTSMANETGLTGAVKVPFYFECALTTSFAGVGIRAFQKTTAATAGDIRGSGFTATDISQLEQVTFLCLEYLRAAE